MNFEEQLNSANKKESTVTFKPINYVGVGKVNLISLNPNAEEITKIFNLKKMAREPLPYAITIDVDGKQVETVKLDFYVKGADDSNVKSFKNKMFFAPFRITLENRAAWNRDKTKILVIDEYGQYCNMTVEEFKTKKIKMNSLGIPAVSKNFRAAKVGEIELIGLLKTLFDIPSPISITKEKDGINTYKLKSPEELESCKLMLDESTWTKLFKGDVSSLKKYFTTENSKLKPIKIMFGLKRKDGNEYQTIAPEVFIPGFSLRVKEFENWMDHHCKDNSIWEYSSSPVREVEAQPKQNSIEAAIPKSEPQITEEPATFEEDFDMPF